MATQEVKVFVQENDVKRQLVGEELTDYLAQAKLDAEAFAEQLKAEKAMEAKKAALLDRLGITAEEAKLLLG
jgi:uncharacterized protein YdbL (DUF1318 family)